MDQRQKVRGGVRLRTSRQIAQAICAVT